MSNLIKNFKNLKFKLKEGKMEFLYEMLKEQYGKELTAKIIQGLSKRRKTTLRVNTIKSSLEKVENELQKVNIKYQRVVWSNNALIIESVDSITNANKYENENISILENTNENTNSIEKVLQNMDIYKNGEIYLQSLSSMLPPIILEPKENTDILDMAAAPGGKTTEIAAITNNKSHITACEKNKIRADRLKYNVSKQGATCVFVMQKDARFIDDLFSFDQILLDAPCSGSGTLDLNSSNTEKYFSKELIERSAKTQKFLLQKAIKLLKPGHTMVYSTCSILKEENEEVLESCLDNPKFNGKIEIEPINFNGIDVVSILPTSIDGTLCVCPTDLYEGFFVAKIKKNK